MTRQPARLGPHSIDARRAAKLDMLGQLAIGYSRGEVRLNDLELAAREYAALWPRQTGATR